MLRCFPYQSTHTMNRTHWRANEMPIRGIHPFILAALACMALIALHATLVAATSSTLPAKAVLDVAIACGQSSDLALVEEEDPSEDERLALDTSSGAGPDLSLPAPLTSEAVPVESRTVSRATARGPPCIAL
jgi:hypothetical protein